MLFSEITNYPIASFSKFLTIFISQIVPIILTIILHQKQDYSEPPNKDTNYPIASFSKFLTIFISQIVPIILTIILDQKQDYSEPPNKDTFRTGGFVHYLEVSFTERLTVCLIQLLPISCSNTSMDKITINFITVN